MDALYDEFEAGTMVSVWRSQRLIVRVLVGPMRAAVGVAAVLLVLSASGAMAATAPSLWSFPTGFDYGPHTYLRPLSDISCASSSLCVGVDGDGYNIVTTTNPTAATPTWGAKNSGDGWPLYHVSCASASFCAATGHLGDFVVSTDPADGTSATWTVKTVPGNEMLGSVSCPSTTLCVATTISDDVVSTTDPTAPSPTWSVKSVNASGYVSCPTATFCAVTTQTNDVIVSTDPGDGANATWTATGASSHLVGDFFGLSCPSQSLCVGVDSHGSVVTSTDPADGASATWTSTAVDQLDNRVDAISCPSVSLCVVGDMAGNTIVSSDPADGVAATWTTTNVDADTLAGIPRKVSLLSCARASTVCVAADPSGYALATADPRGVAPAWVVSPAETYVKADQNGKPTAVSCPSVSFCAAVDELGNVVTTKDPAAGETAVWKQAAGVDRGRGYDPGCGYPGAPDCGAGQLDDISCPSLSLCVAVDNLGHIATSTNPSAGNPSWTLTPQSVDGYGPLTGVSCPSVSLCIALDGNHGKIFTSTDPTNGSSWKAAYTHAGIFLDAVSCSSQAFCAAVDSSGDVVTSTDPADGVAATWTMTAQNVDDGKGLTSVSCPSASLCVAVDGPDESNTPYHVIVSTNPLGDASNWTPVAIPSGTVLYSVSCPSTSECVATGKAYGAQGVYNVLTSVDPAGGSSVWKARAIPDAGGYIDVSCPSERMCVAIAQGAFTRAAVGHKLTVKRAGNGVGHVASGPAGIKCGPTCAFTFAEGSQITLTPASTSSSVFFAWSGGGCSTARRCHVTLSADTTVTARFALKSTVCVVPNVVKKTLAAAKAAITAGRCGVGTIRHATSTKIAKGKVISQLPSAGTALKKGSKVGIVVSSGAH